MHCALDLGIRDWLRHDSHDKLVDQVVMVFSLADQLDRLWHALDNDIVGLSLLTCDQEM